MRLSCAPQTAIITQRAEDGDFLSCAPWPATFKLRAVAGDF